MGILISDECERLFAPGALDDTRLIYGHAARRGGTRAYGRSVTSTDVGGLPCMPRCGQYLNEHNS